MLLALQSEALLSQFAIGGAVAASFYLEAVATEDLDIFAFIAPAPSGSVLLTPLYDRMKELGGTVHNEHVVVGRWPVQILPAYNPLVEEAIIAASLQNYDSLQVPVVSATHLAAIALQLGRPKDYQRVHDLLQSGLVDSPNLDSLIRRHGLQDRWSSYAKRYA
jgi:hypothetical protein